MGLFGRSKHAQGEDEERRPTELPPPPPESVSFETVLGPGSFMRGDLYTPGSVRLEGTFEGSLELDGNALVGENARITADIVAGNNVTIAGAVRGNVSGQRVQLLRTGRVWGDIEASSISTEEGAFIQGTITMKGGEIPPVFEEMAPFAAAAAASEAAASETAEAEPVDAEPGVVEDPDIPLDEQIFAAVENVETDTEIVAEHEAALGESPWGGAVDVDEDADRGDDTADLDPLDNNGEAPDDRDMD